MPTPNDPLAPSSKTVELTLEQLSNAGRPIIDVLNHLQQPEGGNLTIYEAIAALAYTLGFAMAAARIQVNPSAPLDRAVPPLVQAYRHEKMRRAS